MHSRVAAKRMGSAVLFTDTSDRVLLVVPAYKNYWELPVAAVDGTMSPGPTVTLGNPSRVAEGTASLTFCTTCRRTHRDPCRQPVLSIALRKTLTTSTI